MGLLCATEQTVRARAILFYDGLTMQCIHLTHTGRPVINAQRPDPVAGPHDLILRVRAAGICHSDVHYRSGTSYAGPLPLTPGHEIAGEVESLGTEVKNWSIGDRVAVHYLATCGVCPHCVRDADRFCASAQMFGKHRDGGWAQRVSVPGAPPCACPMPCPSKSRAILMCSSSTSLHAIRKARFKTGETLAVFGVGGLGISAIRIAKILGARSVYAVDLDPRKLALAERDGAIPIDARADNPAAQIRRRTGGAGVDVALELIGLPQTMAQAVQCLAIKGRAAIAGITDRPMTFTPYTDLLGREAELIGVSDHTLGELRELVNWAACGALDLSDAITDTVPLEAKAINRVLDDLEKFSRVGRTVVVPA